jgi:hypothetical protein
MTYKKGSESSKIYNCECCDYITIRKSQYDRHLLTAKHKILTNTPQKVPKVPNSEYICECGKYYKHRQSLNNHRKKCEKGNDDLTDTTKIDSTMVLELIKQNKELQNQIISLAQSKQDVQINSNNTNNFNISVFLNEHCKDAINFSDFIDNIRVSHEDLQNNAQLGFVGGISKIITDNLKQLTLHERPIHCTDAKRETMYIKDEDSWQKDKSLVQQKLNRAIQEVSRKSVSSLMKWKQNNPDYADLDSDFSTLCLTMQQQSIAGMNREKFYPKVIHRIAECVPCKP